jgi:uncharacterized protein (TIGR01777 family)
MKETILLAGGTGLVGSRLLELIDYSKYKVHILSRKKKPDSEHINYFTWDFKNMEIESGAVDVDYIINFTGAGIADSRWTDSRKKLLISSRVDSARLIKQGLEKSKHRPKAYISASAVGFYGDRGNEKLTELSPPGSGFMAECCEQWEDSAKKLKDLVDRLVINRIGIVLSTKGGALPKILMTKAVGVYNYFGSGNQYYSWIHIDDLCRGFLRNITDDSMSGIYNAVAPKPLTNKDFTIDIKNALGGIAALPAPKFGLRLLLGEMADVVLNSNRVYPTKLESENFRYDYADLGLAVQDLVSRNV